MREGRSLWGLFRYSFCQYEVGTLMWAPHDFEGLFTLEECEHLKKDVLPFMREMNGLTKGCWNRVVKSMGKGSSFDQNKWLGKVLL